MHKGILGIAALAVLAAGCTANAAVRAPEARFGDDTTVHQSVTRLDFRNTNGNVTVTEGRGAVTVHRDVHYRGTKPGRTTSVAGGTLSLESCGGECSVDYRITVPPGTSVTGSVDAGVLTLTDAATVDIRVGTGTVKITGATGVVHAAANTGSITVQGASAGVFAQTGSGDVVATGLKGDTVSVQSETGDVTVSTVTAQRVLAETTTGDVSVTVAPGSYRVTASTRTGDTDVQVPNDPAARLTLKATAETGDVHVRTSR
jgi:DUF4097 and DUF4098 domain-containing protein YvlB